MNWIKQLFCKHDYLFVRNIYGDEIRYSGYNRSLAKCTKCGKYKLYKHLVKGDKTWEN
jgi:hypothetical protein